MKSVRLIFSRLFSDALFRDTVVLFAGMMMVNLCNVSFQMVVGRVLPSEEYALLAAFLGVLAIFQRPLSTLVTGVSHYSRLLQQDDRTGDVKRLLRKWLLVMGIPSLLFGAAVVGLNAFIADFFHLDRVAPVVVTGLLFPALFCAPVLGGAVQGLQLFGCRTAASIFGALVRFGLAAGFVWLIYPACGWALLGHGLGLYVAAGVLLLGLMYTLRGHKKSTVALPSLRFYLFQSFFVLAAYAVLLTADVVLVKHFIPDDTDFAFAATLGRMVVFLTGAIVVAMFPKVVSKGAGSHEQRRVFMKSLGWTALFAVAAVFCCAVFPDLLYRMIFGKEASEYLRNMLVAMSLVMGLSALLHVTIQYLLAQRRFRIALMTVGFAVLYLLGVLIFHSSSWQIVLVSAVCNGGALIVALWALAWRSGAD